MGGRGEGSDGGWGERREGEIDFLLTKSVCNCALFLCRALKGDLAEVSLVTQKEHW